MVCIRLEISRQAWHYFVGYKVVLKVVGFAFCKGVAKFL